MGSIKKLGLSIIDETLNSNKEASALTPDDESAAKMRRLFDDTKRFLDRYDAVAESRPPERKLPFLS